MTLFNILLLVHVLAAIVWIGGPLTGMLIGQLLRRSGDASLLGRYCIAFAEVSGPLYGASSLLVVGSGVWMVIDAPHIEFSALWVSLGFGLWLVSMVMGATVVGGSWFKLGKQLDAGATMEATAALASRAVLLTWIDLALRVAAVAVMIWRPA